jgi:hypothetical protein
VGDGILLWRSPSIGSGETAHRTPGAFPAILVLRLGDRQTFQNFRMIDRQQNDRVEMRYAVSLWKPSNGTFTRTLTENLTSEGFFCVSNEPYRQGDQLEATLEVPHGRRWNMPRLALQCQVEVVRVKGRQSRIGFRIKEYTVIQGSPASLTNITE